MSLNAVGNCSSPGRFNVESQSEAMAVGHVAGCHNRVRNIYPEGVEFGLNAAYLRARCLT